MIRARVVLFAWALTWVPTALAASALALIARELRSMPAGTVVAGRHLFDFVALFQHQAAGMGMLVLLAVITALFLRPAVNAAIVGAFAGEGPLIACARGYGRQLRLAFVGFFVWAAAALVAGGLLFAAYACEDSFATETAFDRTLAAALIVGALPLLAAGTWLDSARAAMISDARSLGAWRALGAGRRALTGRFWRSLCANNAPLLLACLLAAACIALRARTHWPLQELVPLFFAVARVRSIAALVRAA